MTNKRQKHKNITVVFIPGLGDHSDSQQKIASGMERFGAKTSYVPMHWSSDKKEAFNNKLDRTLAAIDLAVSRGDCVAIIGVSAGASMAMHAYYHRADNVKALVTVCGKLNYPERVGEHYFKNNPALRQCLFELEKVKPKLTRAHKEKILAVSPYFDEVVPVHDMSVEGTQRLRLVSAGHAITIAAAMTIYKHKLWRFIREQINRTT